MRCLLAILLYMKIVVLCNLWCEGAAKKGIGMSKDGFQLDQAFGFNVNRTAFLMTEEIARRFSAAGYSLVAQEFGLLYRLQQRGPMTQVEIGLMLMRDKTTVTRRVDGMVRKGMVVRQPDPDDRRRVLIALTDSGARALAEVQPLVGDFQLEVLGDIPEGEREITMKTLQAVTIRLLNMKNKE